MSAHAVYISDYITCLYICYQEKTKFILIMGKDYMFQQIIVGDCLRVMGSMQAESVHCIITSPPYWGLRDYGNGPGQIGIEPKPDCLGWATGMSCPSCYVCRLTRILLEAKRILAKDGTLWLVMNDTYATQAGQGYSPGGGEQGNRWKGDYMATTWQPNRAKIEGIPKKSLVGIPWRLALSLQSIGWIIRNDIIWRKPNPLPESVKDRLTRTYEHVFLLTKSNRYFFDQRILDEPAKYPYDNRKDRASPDHKSYPVDGYLGQNGMRTGYRTEEYRRGRDVWNVATQPYKGEHFAAFPTELAKKCMLAGMSKDGICLDPFAGSGTVLSVAKTHDRRAIGIELNPHYAALCQQRLRQTNPHQFDLFKQYNSPY